MRTAIIEKENLGGVCLNWGCIPTKALLKSGELYEKLGHLREYGLSVTGRSYDFTEIVQRSRAIAAKPSFCVAFLMKKQVIEVVLGNATSEKSDATPHVRVALKDGGFSRAGTSFSPPVREVTVIEVLASVGLTEAQALAANTSIKVGRFPFRVNGKAIAAGDTEGFIKTVFDASSGALLGAHLIGAEVTEMIQGFALAITMEATEEDLIATVFPHPTLSEVMHESTLDAYGRALHM